MAGELSPKQLRAVEETLWRRGDLRFLFGALPIVPPRVGVASLRGIYDWVSSRWGGDALFLLCHRRTGKTSVVFIKAGELAIKFPRSRLAIVTDTKEHAVDLSKQIAGPIFDRAPEGVRPVWHESQRAWLFPNGSRIEMYGNEPNQSKRARGSKFRAVFIEEARDLPHLETSVETVYKPALADTEGSQLLFATTVPEQEDTPCERYYRQAVEAGRAHTLPLSENPDYPRSYYEGVARESLGGEMGGAFQREQECVWMHEDDARLIVPEFTPAARLEVVRAVPRQPWDRWMCGLDPGGNDPTGLVWARYDDHTNHLHVERELQIRELVTTAELARRIREVEADLFRHGRPARVERWCDITDTQLIHNLTLDQGLDFRGSANDDLWGNMDQLRRAVQERTLSIDPSCRQLAWELTHSRRTNNGKAILRTPKHGHADVLMALYYAHRNLVRKARPVAKPAPAQPLVEMGLIQPRPVNIVEWVRRPYGMPTSPLPGMKRRLR